MRRRFTTAGILAVLSSLASGSSIVACTSLLGDFNDAPGPVALDGAVADGTASVDADANQSTDSAAVPDADGAAPPAAGLRVASGEGLELWGVTSDDYVIYADAQGVLWAVKTNGQNPTQITSGILQSQFALISGRFVVVAVPQGTATNEATVVQWTASGSTQTVGYDISTRYPAVAMSPDGSHFLFFTQADDADSTATLAFGTLGQYYPEVNGVSLVNPQPSFGFAGTAPDGIVSYTLATDAGNSNPTASTIAILKQNGTSSILTTTANPYQQLGPFDATLTRFLYLDNTMGLVLATDPPGPNGAKVVIDANGLSGAFIDNGSTLIWSDESGAVYSSPTSAISPTLLESTSCSGYVSVSPDGTRGICSKSSAQIPIYVADLTVISTSQANTKQSVVTTPTTAAQGFTSDSSYVVYLDHVVSFDGSSTAFTGSLEAYSLATNTPIAAVSTTAYGGYEDWLPLTGGKIVFYDNPVSIPSAADSGLPDGLRVDLRVVDFAASPPTAKLVQPQVTSSTPTTDSANLVYLYDGPNYQPGIYVVPVP